MVDRSLDAHIAASALAAMVGNFAYFWLALGEEYDEAAAHHTLTRLWANALGLSQTVSVDNATESSASSRGGHDQRLLSAPPGKDQT